MNDRNGAERQRFLGLASMAVVLISWSFGPALSQRVTAHPIVTAFLRVTVAALLQWVASIILRVTPNRAMLRRALLPGAMFCLNMILFFFALRHASVATVILLSALQPALVLFAAGPLFHERISRADVAWTAVALAGAAYAVLGANAGKRTVHTTPLGALLASASMICFAGYFMIGKLQNSHHGSGPPPAPPHPIAYMACILTGASLTSVPFLIATGHVDDLAHVTASQSRAIALIILVPTVGHLFLTYTHRHIDAMLTSLLMLIQPITASLVAWWLVKQPMVWAQAIGGTIVIGAIAALTVQRSRAAHTVPTSTDPSTTDPSTHDPLLASSGVQWSGAADG